jgi:DNA modification methylase
MNTFSFYLIIFFCTAYLIISDQSISQAFVYIFDLAKNKLIQKIWWLKNNPANPIIKYMMWRRAYKLAEELQKELAKKQKNV